MKEGNIPSSPSSPVISTLPQFPWIPYTSPDASSYLKTLASSSRIWVSSESSSAFGWRYILASHRVVSLRSFIAVARRKWFWPMCQTSPIRATTTTSTIRITELFWEGTLSTKYNYKCWIKDPPALKFGKFRRKLHQTEGKGGIHCQDKSLSENTLGHDSANAGSPYIISTVLT